MRARFLNPQIILTAVLLLLLPAMLHAQTTQGTILGTVHDSAGAVIPHATVTLTSLDEGTTRTTQSNAAGDYKFVDVKEGHYTVTMQAQGFDKFVVDGVSLAVRQELRIDGTLAVGAVKQEVVVNGDQASAIDTESPTISGTFTADDALNLPVNTRASFGGTSAYNILGAMPGMQGDSYTGGFSLQGALPYQLEVTVDGITLKNPAGSSVIGDAFPSSESISEIRADGALANAEYGDPGQVVVTTKAGTNNLHGSGFFYYQSSAFDAIPYTYPTTTTKPSLQGKTFGGSVGGPVVLPHYNGHNKTFFYGAYEGWRHPAQTTEFEKVPSTLMKQGDFSKYNSNTFTGLTDPYTGQNWGTQIPSGQINTIATNTLKQFYPDPNIGDPTAYTDDSTANYQRNVDASGQSNQFDVRGDQYFGSTNGFLLWGRFTWKDFPTNSGQILDLPSSVNTSNDRVMKVDANWNISPHFVNEGGFGFTFYTSGSSNPFNGYAWTNSQGWQGLQNLFYNGIPEMDFNNLQSLNADRLTSLSKSKTYDYSDTLIWTHGLHIVKFGGDIQALEAITPLGFNGSDNYGTYTFNTSGSNGLFTGVDFGDFLLGIPDQTFYDVVRQDNDGLSNHYAFFGQDEWRVTRQLTLSYGLRYELHPGYYDRYGDIANFDPTYAHAGRVIYPQNKQSLLAQSFLASANACDPDGVDDTNSATVNGAPCMPVLGNATAGYPSGLKMYPHLRFMPRFGFAYSPTAKENWVVRGGVGLYNINMLGSSFYSLTGTAQAQTQQFSNTYNPATHAIGYQWPQVYAGSGGAAGVGNYGTDYFGTANSANWQDPYTIQWTMGVDHDLGNGYAGRITYIGSETHHETWAPDENTLPFSTTMSAYNAPITDRLFPNWGRINNRMTSANASYNSLQLEATHRLQHGLEYDSVFTWAKSLADNQGPGNFGFAGEGGGDRATSILDREADFGNVFGTRRLKWNTTALYDLPFGRGSMFGSSIPRAADVIAGGWRFSTILTVQSGPFESPYFPSGQGDPSGTGSGLNSSLAGFDPSHREQVPDRNTSVNMSSGRTRLAYYNLSAFTCPGYAGWQPGTPCTTGSGSGPVPLPIGRFGNAQAGSAPGPGLFNLSTGLSKSVDLTEGIHLNLEGTFTNVLNHTNLGDPNMNLSSPNFGQISNTVGTDFGGARTGQIAARIEF
ncbi:MAG TPA: carboxypeptidase-like regulatory domain-containing protein [Acidobacteriaceae bacterium]|nr:carboxypeptidase-like regulatory domain-containing protein [Acidobacteriaceae bacterium]